MNTWGIPNPANLAAEMAIRDVLIGYCRWVDLFEDDQLLELFTEDAQWLRPNKPPLQGRAEIAIFLKERDRGVTSRHISNNQLIHLTNPDRATAISLYTVLKSAPGTTPQQALVPGVLGEYHDEFRLDDGRWRIAFRDTRHVFRAN